MEIEIQYLFGLVKVNTMMARVNEPPKGSDCNVCTKITGSNVEFIAERDISTNGNLVTIDYSNVLFVSDYDRFFVIVSQRNSSLITEKNMTALTMVPKRNHPSMRSASEKSCVRKKR